MPKLEKMSEEQKKKRREYIAERRKSAEYIEKERIAAAERQKKRRSIPELRTAEKIKDAEAHKRRREKMSEEQKKRREKMSEEQKKKRREYIAEKRKSAEYREKERIVKLQKGRSIKYNTTASLVKVEPLYGDLLELERETKFNILLLLRNRYSQGLAVELMHEKFKTFFGKEINPAIFNPNASNVIWANQQFMADDIVLVSKSGHQYFKAKRDCSDSAMQFLANSTKYQKRMKKNNYVTIKSEDYNGSLLFQAEDSDIFSSKSVDSDIEEVDPLELQSSENANSTRNSPVKTQSAVQESRYNDVRVPFVNEMTGSTQTFANKLQTPSNQATVLLAQAPGLPLKYLIPSQNENSYIIVGYTDNPASQNLLFTDDPPPGPNVIGQLSPKALPKTQPQAANARSDILKCTYEGCKNAFYTERRLERHIRLSHYDISRGPLNCDTVGCSMKFFTVKEWKEHGLCCCHKPYKCKFDECRRTFTKGKYLGTHVNTMHKLVKDAFKCSVPNCPVAHKKQSALDIHEKRCRFKFETLQQMELDEMTDAHNETESQSIPNQLENHDMEIKFEYCEAS